MRHALRQGEITEIFHLRWIESRPQIERGQRVSRGFSYGMRWVQGVYMSNLVDSQTWMVSQAGETQMVSAGKFSRIKCLPGAYT